jgi:hypothetical protein
MTHSLPRGSSCLHSVFWNDEYVMSDMLFVCACVACVLRVVCGVCVCVRVFELVHTHCKKQRTSNKCMTFREKTPTPLTG